MNRTQQEDKPSITLKAGKSANPSIWQHRHILDLNDFTPGEIELVLNTTDVMKDILSRPIKKVPTLRGKTVAILFYEASTRTRISFELAAKNLSADVVNISASSSSVTKGESLIDTLETLEALGVNIVVMRHQCSGAPLMSSGYVNANIINAGDGAHAHPTQALLDLYTIREHKTNMQGLKVVIIGDIIHSRVARSNIWGLAAVGAKVTLCCPPTLLPQGLNNPLYPFPNVNVETNIDHALEEADVVMTLRLQKERQQSGLLPTIREYIELYQLTAPRLKKARPDALVMHPGPVNEGVEIAPEVVHCPQSVITEQVTNGVAVRMALLYLLAGGKEQ